MLKDHGITYTSDHELAQIIYKAAGAAYRNSWNRATDASWSIIPPMSLRE